MPEQSAPMSPVEIEKGLSNLLATQFLDASEDDAGTDEIEARADTTGEQADIETADETPEGEEQAEATEVEEFALAIKVDGEELQITDRAEAVKLAQLGKHFTKKNEALIQEKQAFESERKETRELRSRYAEALPQVEAFLRMPLGEAPKREAFPDELSYLKADKQFREAQQGVENVRAEWRRVQEEQAKEQAEALRAWVNDQDQQLLSAIPEWTDNAVKASEWRAMEAYAVSKGVNPQALQNPLLVRDKAFVLMLRDAMRYQQVQTKGVTEVKRVQATTAAPGPKPVGDTASRRRKEIEARTKSGKTADIAPAMAHLMARTLELQHTNDNKRKR